MRARNIADREAQLDAKNNPVKLEDYKVWENTFQQTLREIQHQSEHEGQSVIDILGITPRPAVN